MTDSITSLDEALDVMPTPTKPARGKKAGR